MSTNQLGDTIRILMATRNMRANELAEKVGVSKASISKIMNGISRPKQSTFTAMMGVLAANKAERDQLLQSFLSPEDSALPEAPAENLDTDLTAQDKRTRDYLDRRTQSILFEQSVAQLLKREGIAFEENARGDEWTVRFLLDQGEVRTGIECSSNFSRDFDFLVMRLKLLAKDLNANMVLVVPFDAPRLRESNRNLPFRIVEIAELAAEIAESGSEQRKLA